MTDIKQKKENVKMHLKDLRQNLKKMHLEVTEELILPRPDDNEGWSFIIEKCGKRKGVNVNSHKIIKKVDEDIIKIING